MSKIQIGTSGYSYAEWVGPVYPVGTHSREFLSHYAERFPTVELNFSYYRMPRAEQLARLLEKAGPTLTFAIKAHESLTHKIDPAAWQDSAKAFLEALEPVRKANRLEAVLFQFPYSFHYEPEKRRYLDKLLGQFQDVPAAVEFRNNQWYRNRVIEALRERNRALVSLDMPSVPGLPPTLDAVTAPLAYIRLHGRNQETWWGTDAAARYDYQYSDTELEAWKERIKRIVVTADKVLVYFNNHPKGQAAQNAQTLTRMLEGSSELAKVPVASLRYTQIRRIINL
ncbi:MAG: DUF72 domain-containing protein [Treponema sp.]|jgi:uncharacterized protein YecE (DUF72 family)|nr:DUF72 domain-containing protein [Treponema sp.]